MSFKVGDSMQLKGGGPIMTVTSIGKDRGGKPRIFCTWFDDQGNEKTSSYPPEALKLYPGESGSTSPADDD